MVQRLSANHWPLITVRKTNLIYLEDLAFIQHGYGVKKSFPNFLICEPWYFTSPAHNSITRIFISRVHEGMKISRNTLLSFVDGKYYAIVFMQKSSTPYIDSARRVAKNIFLNTKNDARKFFTNFICRGQSATASIQYKSSKVFKHLIVVTY